MKISLIFAWIFVACCTVVLCLDTYDTLKTSYYSNDPNSTVVNGQVVQIDKYSIELSENGIQQFKKEINDDFFHNEYIKYETYEDYKNAIKILEKLVKYFDKEVIKSKYPRDNNIIRGINNVFTHVLTRISNEKKVIAWYDQRSIKKSIRMVKNEITKSNDPIWELIKIWCLMIIIIIISIFAAIKEIKDKTKKN